MRSQNQQKRFVQWLDAALQDERWRAFIRAEVQRHELPVIELAADFPRVKSSALAHRQMQAVR